VSTATIAPAIGSVTGLAAGVATFLGTPSSANLIAAVTDETGTGALVFANTPALVTPNIGAATGTSVSLTSTAQILNATAITAGGTAGNGYKFSSTANFGVFYGSGAPTLSAAQGSLYLRSDGVPYYNTNGTTGWSQLPGAGVITAGGPTGSATVVPVITYNAAGQLTTVTTATIAPAISSVTGLGTGVATFLGTPSSANLAAALTDETGSGAAVFANSPALTGTPTVPTAAGGTNTTQAASTAFVAAGFVPLGTAVVGQNVGTVTLNNTANYFNLLSAALSIGTASQTQTWIVFGSATFSQSTGATFDYYNLQIYNVTDAAQVGASVPTFVSSNPAGWNAMGSTMEVVTITGVKSIQLRGQDASSTNGSCPFAKCVAWRVA
jgi:hypothetical protein